MFLNKIQDSTVVAPDDENLWVEHNTKIREYVVPQTWSFDANGRLKAFEFLTTDTPMPNPTESFVKELYSELKKLGLVENLGIRRIVNFRGRSSWETTPDGSRSNVVVFGKKPENVTEADSVTVLWYFDENGMLHRGASCIFCNTCNTCNHCYTHRMNQLVAVC